MIAGNRKKEKQFKISIHPLTTSPDDFKPYYGQTEKDAICACLNKMSPKSWPVFVLVQIGKSCHKNGMPFAVTKYKVEVIK